jgi:hypothetical protein
MLLEFLLFVVVVHGVIKPSKYSAPFSAPQNAPDRLKNHDNNSSSFPEVPERV